MASTKFTFKTKKSSLYFGKDHIIIKLKGKQVGEIFNDFPFSIRLMVEKTDINEDGNPNCTWKWITLSKKLDTLDSAKEWINLVADEITKKFTLHLND
jgi:hypothetical protein